MAMAKEAFDANFWDWAAYDLNWINIAAQERWLNGKGCPLDCNESNIDRLNAGLQPHLNQHNPATGNKLFDMLKTLDKYRGDHKIGAPEADADMNIVCGLIRELINEIPELKEREVTLQDWCDNGTQRNVAFMVGKEGPAPVLMPPSMR